MSPTLLEPFVIIVMIIVAVLNLPRIVQSVMYFARRTRRSMNTAKEVAQREYERD